MKLQSVIVYQAVKLGQHTRSSFNMLDGFELEYHGNYISVKKDKLHTCVGMSNVSQFTLADDSESNDLKPSKKKAQ